MKVCVVVAAYDERENVEPLTRRLRAALASIPGCRAEIVYVVEGTDGTREVLERLAREIPGLRVLYSEKPAGLGAAFRRGFAAVPRDADWVVTMDADLNHQPEELPRLLAVAGDRGLDVVVGSRFVRGASVEGIPLWKRALSGTMNVVMRHLYGLSVLDKTSGYRVYRAAALRKLSFVNDDFAFLPELLIDAHRQGLRVGEEPIRFVYRVAGSSKMRISTTVRSYLLLLRSRFDRWSLAAGLLLGAGMALRLLVTFPLAKWGGDGDALLSGMTAFRVAEGKFPVFYSGVRIGALESYVHAAAFAVFGVSRDATALAPLLANAAFLVVFLLLARSLLGRQRACLALVFVAIPSPSFLFWTYQPNGYPLTVLFMLATLLFADRIARRGGGVPSAVAFGLSAGLGFWNSIQTVATLLPAIAWILVHRPARGRRLLLAGVATVAFLLGAAPWIAFNTRHGFPSFRSNFAARPASGLWQTKENAEYFVGYSVPELLVPLDPEDGATPPNGLQTALRLPVAAVHAAAFLLVCGLLIRWAVSLRTTPSPPPPWTLLVLAAATMAALNVVSEAGANRGLTVRYVLPCYFLAAAALGLLLHRTGRGRVLAALGAAAVVAFNLAGSPLPGSPFRERMKRDASSEREVVDLLRQEKVAVVVGNYWYVYPVNFLTSEAILGIPYQPEFDYYRYAGRVPSAPGRWALFSRTPGEIETWLSRTGDRGTVRRLGNDHVVFLPEPNPPDDTPLPEAVERLRRAIYPAAGTP